MACSSPQLQIGLLEPQPGVLEFPCARRGFQMRATQGVVGRCAQPLAGSLLLIQRALRIGLVQRGQGLGQRGQVRSAIDASRRARASARAA